MSHHNIVITGAASGLGWELSKAYLAQGDRLLLIDRDSTLLQQRQQELAAPQRVHIAVADLATSAGITAAVNEIHSVFDRVDALVNNAGITHRSLVSQTQVDVFRKVMAVDWQAPIELATALLPKLRESRGSVINIGSMAGWMPVLGRAAYCSAKSALGQFFEVLRAEEQDHGVHVLMVYPAFVNTNIEHNALGGDGKAARHARSTAGGVSEAAPLAAQIVSAHARRRPRLYPHRGIWLASLLWRLLPDLFQRLMRRQFAVELRQTG